jgi:hypothetical protein
MSRGRKDTAAAEHHYFPKALQKFWKDDHGWVHRLRADGKRDRSKNGTFGHLRNAHHIKLSDSPSPWDESFEYTFGPIDSAIPRVVELLAQAETPLCNEERPWRDRFGPQWNLENHRSAIAQLIASLVVRSPCLRNSIRLGVLSYHSGKGPWPGGEVPSALISMNQKPLLERYARALSDKGKVAILFSDHREFIFGDGLLHNFQIGGPNSPYNPRCLVPLTPTIAVGYDCPSQWAVSANFVAVRLSPEEVNEVNWCTQVYSGQYLFYRSGFPSDISSFRQGEHRQLRFHEHGWFDGMMRELANARF